MGFSRQEYWSGLPKIVETSVKDPLFQKKICCIHLLTLIPILPQDFHTTTSDLGTVILLKTVWQPGFKMFAQPSVTQLLVTQPCDVETVSPPLAPPVGRDSSLITITAH